ncbi:Gfo/Idh/MocA family oxidoreductase [Chitinolyticbacter meiyuanensis]|uniref:Gfo/Idh/MocA family oxidoreductase n=1 Tax=Chitinolyticbacter meiyuanensis TaxID=682798 RepID=UPI0011E5FD15|nr:Gfo/Idh/MocA family oxidoreductase [Chitinolyticbacter meiyuanensis]
MSNALRIGIIGCADYTHGRMWARQWHQEAQHGLVAARVWDADASVAVALANEIGAEVVSTPQAVAEGCDGVVIATLQPADYLALAAPHLAAGRRVFLNRPLAGSVADARSVFALADAHSAAVYSASALLHTRAASRIRATLAEIGALRYFSLVGPTDTADWYLPHLYACLASTLGPGLARVVQADLPSLSGDPHRLRGPATVMVEYAADSPVGAARGTLTLLGPGSDWYGFTLKLYGSSGVSAELDFDVGYELLFAAMRRFFLDGTAPTPRALMLEQVAAHYATLQAAASGQAVALEAVR